MRLKSIRIDGFRPFRDFHAELGALEVIVGANGSGKSSLFELLKFLRDGMTREIPRGVIEGPLDRHVFHIPGPESFSWHIEIGMDSSGDIVYGGEVTGPVYDPRVVEEWAVTKDNLAEETNNVIFKLAGEDAAIIRGIQDEPRPIHRQPRELALGTFRSVTQARDIPAVRILSSVREYLEAWRFFSAWDIARDKIRRPVFVEQNPELREDMSNLSAILFHLFSERPQLFRDLQVHLRGIVPGFEGLAVKAKGGPGEVMAFWQERGVEADLNLADLSDGNLLLLGWCTFLLYPGSTPLVCIDEPEQGIHPRTLAVLAALIQRASERTQILVATHNSFFLSHFETEEIAVMRKENGKAVFRKPRNSKILTGMLEDFGKGELEILHRSDELEHFA